MLSNLIRLGGALPCASAVSVVLAREYPNRPVRLIIPFPPGGSVAMKLAARVPLPPGRTAIAESPPGCNAAPQFARMTVAGRPARLLPGAFRNTR